MEVWLAFGKYLRDPETGGKGVAENCVMLVVFSVHSVIHGSKRNPSVYNTFSLMLSDVFPFDFIR